MPRTPCLTCGTPTDGTYCPAHTKANTRKRNARRTHYHGDWERRSRQARDAWVAEHGWTCPGQGRPPHPVAPGTLQLDHTTGRVLCGPCNVAAGPAGPTAAIPH